MSTESEALNLIKYSLFGGTPPRIAHWDAVVRELKRHAILPLGAVIGLEIPAEYSEIFTRAYYKNLRRFGLHSRAIRELNGLFARPVILKGIAAAQYYAAPAKRTIGDIDFILPGEDFDRAVAVMLENGFVRTEDERRDLSETKHRAFDKKGVHYELHRYFSLNISEKNRRLDELIRTALPEAHSAEGCSFFSLPDALNGLVLLEHITHHLQEEGLGLRQIIDWACFVNVCLTDELWAAAFGALAEECTPSRLLRRRHRGPCPIPRAGRSHAVGQSLFPLIR